MLHKLECGIMLIQDQGVYVIDYYWDFPFLKEYLQLVPVVFLLLVVLGIVEGVHLDVGREVPGEYLGYKETVIEGSIN